jgi:hypothetical protein
MPRLFVAALFLLILSVGPVLAGTPDPDVPKPDPKGFWRVITPDATTSTSKCLGSRETPLCVVETAIACEARGGLDLCRRAWGEEAGNWDGLGNEYWEKYRVLAAGRYRQGDRHFDEWNDELPWVPGDVWIIVYRENCYKEECSDLPARAQRYHHKRYILHQEADGWLAEDVRPVHSHLRPPIAPPPAAQADPDLPRPDPKGFWRDMTHDDSSTTSKCLGSRETPLCVVETRLACALRGDADLCRRVWYQGFKPTAQPTYEWWRYRVHSSGHFRKGDPQRDEREEEIGWEPGDMWIVIDEMKCHDDRCFRIQPQVKRYVLKRYILRKQYDGWHVVTAGLWHNSQSQP